MLRIIQYEDKERTIGCVAGPGTLMTEHLIGG